MASISDVISIAEAEVGYLEKASNSQLDSKTANAGSNNYTKYARDLFPSLQGQAWCDMFVDWCFVQAYGKAAAEKILGGFSAYTPTSAGYLPATSSPVMGDIIFFKNSTRICHTGIIYKVDSSKVYTIEGNTSGASGVIANGGGVCKKSYSKTYSSIAKFARPKWEYLPVSDPDGNITPGGVTQTTKDQTGKVLLSAHMRDKGWGAWVADGAMAGTTGQNRRIEAIKIKPVKQMDVTVHIKDTGDKKYSNITNSTIIGTTGEKKRLEAIKIESSDTIYVYRVHQKDIGWSAWVTNGEWAGTKGKSKQIEAIELKVAGIVYQAHVQGDGWTTWVADGTTAGTTGKSKRVEAIRINPCGLEIEASAQLQDEGWKDYGKITKDTIIGTTGESKRLECLKLKGNIDYCLYLQNSGWTSWTKADGIATMGSVGQALRVEAIQIRKRS